MSDLKTIKVVPNPAYSLAQFEEVIIDTEGREVEGLKPFPRYATLQDARDRTNPIPSHIVQEC